MNLNPFSVVRDIAQIGVNKIALDRHLEANYDFIPLKQVLPEAFFGTVKHIRSYLNLTGSLCLDLGHTEAIYLVTEPPYIRAPLSRGKLPVKIGKHDKGVLLRRIEELGYRRERLQVLAFISVPSSKLVEDALHGLFEPGHVGKEAVGTEWFDVNPVEAIEAALWISVLSCLDAFTEGDLIDLTLPESNSGSSGTIKERYRRLSLVHKCIKRIDPTFSCQGTKFRIGDVRGRGFDSRNRPESLCRKHYPFFPLRPEDPNIEPDGQLNIPLIEAT